MKTLILAVFFVGGAWAQQCGKLVINPITHKLDCSGVGATGATGPAGTGFNGAGTFASMNASSPATNNVWELTDATSSGYCGAGAGTSKAVCVWTGAAWVPASGVLAGGLSGQVPFQTGVGATGFSTGISYNDTTKTLGLSGGYIAGQVGVATGQIVFNGTTSGSVTIKPNSVAGTAITMLLPSGDSNPVRGTADPSDSQLVNWIGTDGTIHRIAVPPSNIVGGSGGQVAFQSAANTTAFSTGLAYNDTTKTLGLIGGFAAGQTGTGTGQLALNGLTSGTVTIKPNAVAGTATVLLPAVDSNPVVGIANPSDTSVINYIGVDGVQNRIAQSGGGGGSPTQRTLVTATATPTFAVTSTSSAYMVLTPTSDVTSSTLTVASGNPLVTLAICQGATPRTVVLPTNVLNAPAAVDPRAHYCTVMAGNYDGTNLIIDYAEIRKDDGSTIPGELSISQATGTNVATLKPIAGAASRTVSIPGSADSAIPLAYSCGAGNHAVSFDVATGITTCAADSGTGTAIIPTSTGTSITLSAPNGDAHCTGTCAVSLPVPSAGRNFCVYDDIGVTSAITISNPGSGTMFSSTSRASYGTAGSGTLVSTAGTNSQLCLKATDSTHYSVVSSVGTWTNGAGTSFSGLGDVAGSAFFYTGLRAYSAATKGTKAAQICNAGDSNCVDINSDGTTGDLDMTTVQAAPLNCTTSTCTVRTLYDQAGTNCSNGSPQPCDMFMSTEALRPKLKFSCSGSKPCMEFDASATQRMCSGNSWGGMTGYLSMASVAKRTSSAALGNVLANYDGADQIGFAASGSLFAYFGSSITGTYAEGDLIALGGVFISGAGTLYGNGSSVGSGNPGSNAVSGNPCIGSANAAGNYLTGQIMEVATWNADKTTSQSSFSANQRAYWGF